MSQELKFETAFPIIAVCISAILAMLISISGPLNGNVVAIVIFVISLMFVIIMGMLPLILHDKKMRTPLIILVHTTLALCIIVGILSSLPKVDLPIIITETFVLIISLLSSISIKD